MEHNNNNNNNRDDIYAAVIMAKPLREFTRFIWWMQTQRRGGRQPSDQANRLRLRVRQKEMAATVHIHHRHFIITQPESWYSFYRPTEGGRLSRPRHCSNWVYSSCPRLYIAVAVVINTTARGEIRTWSSHTAVRHVTIRPLRHCNNNNILI